MTRPTLPPFVVRIGTADWRVESHPGFDLSIPLDFRGSQPTFFAAPEATQQALQAGSFVGDVQLGGSCNCSSYSLTPHCNGTHTECVGHVTVDRVSVRDLALPPLMPCVLLSVRPEPGGAQAESSDPAPQPEDRLVTRGALDEAARAFDLNECQALAIRTMPNSSDKRYRNYAERPAAYLTAAAMHWIVELGVDHLIVDLPSIDRAEDGGLLTTHRIFWGLPPRANRAQDATRSHATITELAYMDDALVDGHYMLNLQVAPFVADAAPSRPILLPRTRL